MPGLVGGVGSPFSNRDSLRAMAKPMLHRSDYQVYEHMQGHFSAAAIDLSTDGQNGSARSEDGRYTLIFFGALYESWVNGAGVVASKLLERFSSSGWKALADLNGEYLAVVWDRTDQNLTIVNDRLGLKRLHYWRSNGIFAFASEVKSLAVLGEVNRATDEQALSELLIFGHLQDDRTLLRDVKLLPPASCLVWQLQGKLTLDCYWNYVYQADPALINHERAVDEYHARVKEAVSRRLKGLDRAGLFLSGGLDSRTIGGAIRETRPDMELLTWTAGHGHDHDSRFGKQIARAIGSKHEPVSVPRTFLEDYGADYSWVLDGMVSAHGAHRSCLIEKAVGAVQHVFLGFMGDTVSGGKPLDYIHEVSDVEELAKKSFGIYEVGFNDALFKKLLKNDVYDRISGLAFKSFRSSIQNAKVEFPGDRMVCTELVQRQRLFNPPAQMDLQGADCFWVTPFTDKDFIDFSLRLPWQERLHKKAYIGMLCKYYPELARIPRSGDGLPLRHSRLRAALHWKWVLFKRRFSGHHYGAFVHCADWFRNANAEFIRSKLISNPILEAHFKIEEVNQMVESFLNNTAERDLMDSIAALMSYVLFRERLDVLPKHELNKASEAPSLEKVGV